MYTVFIQEINIFNKNFLKLKISLVYRKPCLMNLVVISKLRLVNSSYLSQDVPLHMYTVFIQEMNIFNKNFLKLKISLVYRKPCLLNLVVISKLRLVNSSYLSQMCPILTNCDVSRSCRNNITIHVSKLTVLKLKSSLLSYTVVQNWLLLIFIAISK